MVLVVVGEVEEVQVIVARGLQEVSGVGRIDLVGPHAGGGLAVHCLRGGGLVFAGIHHHGGAVGHDDEGAFASSAVDGVDVEESGAPGGKGVRGRLGDGVGIWGVRTEHRPDCQALLHVADAVGRIRIQVHGVAVVAGVGGTEAQHGGAVVAFGILGQVES